MCSVCVELSRSVPGNIFFQGTKHLPAHALHHSLTFLKVWDILEHVFPLFCQHVPRKEAEGREGRRDRRKKEKGRRVERKEYEAERERLPRKEMERREEGGGERRKNEVS